MTEILELELCQSRIHSLSETLAAWIAEYRDSLRARDLDDVARKGMEVGEEVLRVYKGAWNRMADGELDDYIAAGQAMQHLFDSTAQAIEAIQTILSEQNQLGPFRGAARLAQTHREVARIRDHIPKGWPWFPELTQKEIEAIWAENARGEHTPIESLIDELQSRIHATCAGKDRIVATARPSAGRSIPPLESGSGGESRPTTEADQPAL